MKKQFFIFIVIFLMSMADNFCWGQGTPRPSVDQIFWRLDRNNDGKIVEREVLPMIWQRLLWADKNRDGAVTKEELHWFRGSGNQKQRTKPDPKPRIGHFYDRRNWDAFDAGNIGGLQTKGYFGAVFDGRYVYFVPCRTFDFHGRVLRYDTRSEFNSSTAWESYDAGGTDGLATRGYAGGVFDGRYVYLVPFATRQSRHARVLRYDTHSQFRVARSWRAYDATQVAGAKAMGFVGAIFDGRYVYLAPFGYRPYAHAYVVRYDTRGDFGKDSSWSAYDASNTDGLQTKGFYGAVFDGSYIYFVPFNDGRVFHGRILRYDTRRSFLNSQSWSAYDAGATGGLDSSGYKGAIYDGRYVYFVPFRNNRGLHCHVLRYDTRQLFKNEKAWTTFDASATDNLDTRGYVGAAFDKRYLYFIAYSGDGQSFHGRFLRFDTSKDFTSRQSWTAFDAGQLYVPATRGYKFAAFDGTYVYFAPYHNGNVFSGTVLRYDTTAKKGQ